MRHIALSDGYVPMLVAVHRFQCQDQITVLMRGAFQVGPIMQLSKEIGAYRRILTSRSWVTPSSPSSIRSKSSTSLSSPSNRSPLVNPGGTVRNPYDFPMATASSSISPSASSRPPGQNGTCPDFPRTKFLDGAGVRCIEVEWRADWGGGLTVYRWFRMIIPEKKLGGASKDQEAALEGLERHPTYFYIAYNLSLQTDPLKGEA